MITVNQRGFPADLMEEKNSYIILILIGVLLGIPLYSLIAITILSMASAIFYGARAVKHLYER